MPLRELTRRWTNRLSDLNFLSALTGLEYLTISFNSGADDCRALRHLTNLKTLKIWRGAVGDFVEYLPKLRTLECHDIFTPRSFCEPGHPVCGFVSPVRRAVLKSRVVLTSFVGGVLQQAEEIVIDTFNIQWVLDCSVLWRLTHVKRLCIKNQTDQKLLRRFVDNFQSLPVLEELSLYLRSSCKVPSNLVRATRLRVLDLHAPSSFETVGKMKQLERLYITSHSKFGVKPLLSLVNLRKIGLPRCCSCLSLRKARGPGGALPFLQRILHPIGDCSETETCVGGAGPREMYAWHFPKRLDWVGDWEESL